VTNSQAGKFTRRDALLRGAGLGAGALALPALLDACGGGSSAGSSSAASAAGTPKAGGNIVLGLVGAGNAETLSPLGATYLPDYTRIPSLFDPLVALANDGSVIPALAESWTPNKDGTVWEIKLRKDVTFHDGSPLTADDVIWTVQQMSLPTSVGAPFTSNIKVKELKKADKHTVIWPLYLANARPLDDFVGANPNGYIFKNGLKDFSNPVGTGPWKFESFSPGQRSVFVRNENYWGPKPYPEKFTLVTSFQDETSLGNAVLGGQLHGASGFSATEFRSLKAAGKVVTYSVPGSQELTYYMRADRPPFTDVRVRQAMRLIIDRQQMVDVVMDGQGVVLNDLYGKGLPLYTDAIPQRAPDIEQAKSLLKAAGQENLQVTLTVGDIWGGMTASAQLYAQQAKAAGVTINVKKILPSDVFNPATGYPYTFSETDWPLSSLAYQYGESLAANAPFNETAQSSNKAWQKMYVEAQGTLDPALQQERWHAVQKSLWDSGGYIFYGRPNTLAAASPRVKGVKTDTFLGGVVGPQTPVNGLWLD
jgi:peptide/nickel transport system substrate-binding protein